MGSVYINRCSKVWCRDDDRVSGENGPRHSQGSTMGSVSVGSLNVFPGKAAIVER